MKRSLHTSRITSHSSLFTLHILLIVCLFVTCFGGTAAQAAKRTGGTYRIQSDGVTEVGSKSVSANYILRVGDGVQLGTKESSANYIVWAGYVYQTNTKPSTPETLTQYKANGTTQISWPAGWTNTSTEVYKASVRDPDPGDKLIFQVEVRLSGEAFTNVPSAESPLTDYSGTAFTAAATQDGMAHAQSYIWQARVKDLENYYSDWVTLAGTPDFRVDLVPPLVPPGLAGFASPESGPTYVFLTWNATTDALSGLAGYNVYRSYTPGSGYAGYYSLLTPTMTTDAGVTVGTDYYYVVAAQDNAGNVSEYSNEGSAPHIKVTREATVAAPVSGGYTGNAADPVPGATITYKIYYRNDGFSRSSNIAVIDKIPPTYTEFKMSTATGDAISSVLYSNDNGGSYTYTPTGLYVDPAVTNIKWSVNDMSSTTEAKKVQFGVVIR